MEKEILEELKKLNSQMDWLLKIVESGFNGRPMTAFRVTGESMQQPGEKPPS